MKQVQRGFTLIELVMVIVILGVLAAVAIPKFVDLKGDAQQSAIDATAGAAASASIINYAACAVVDNVGGNGSCKKVTTCTEVGGLLSGEKFPTDYATTTTAFAKASTECTLTFGGSGGKTATFEALLAGDAT